MSAVRHTNDENANKRVWAGTRCGNVTANRICSAVDCANLCRTRFPLPNGILRNKRQNKRDTRDSLRPPILYLLLAAISDYSVRLDPMDTTVSRSCRLSPADPIYFPLGLTAKEQHLLIAPDTQDVSIGDTDGILRAGRGGGGGGDGENAVRRDRRKRKSGIPTCREDICVMKYPGDTAWPFSSTPGNTGKSKFHGNFHAFPVIFNSLLLFQLSDSFILVSPWFENLPTTLLERHSAKRFLFLL